jgi:hypothetical protein
VSNIMPRQTKITHRIPYSLPNITSTFLNSVGNK